MDVMPPETLNLETFAAEALRERIHALNREVDGVATGEDIEFIHRMRVASRRLRTALAVFEPVLPKKRFKEWNRGVRRITKALGAARDLDVQLEFVTEFLGGVSDERQRKGIERLALRLKQARVATQKKVLKALARMEKSDLCLEMEEGLHDLAIQARLASGHVLDLRENANAVIAEALAEFLSFEIQLPDPLAVESHHEMRIAAKHLRYCMEIFEPVYGAAISEFLKSAKEIQRLLGDLHDCDVWAAHLPAFLDEERARVVAFYGSAKGMKRIAEGLHYLQENRRASREQLYQETLAYWRHLQSGNVWGRLRQELDQKPPAVATVVETPASAVPEGT